MKPLVLERTCLGNVAKGVLLTVVLSLWGGGESSPS